MTTDTKPSERIGDGGQAFPTPPVKGVKSYEDDIDGERGMTLRDYFAAAALTGFMANSDIPDIMRKGFKPDGAAEAVYLIADSMLKERKVRR